MHRKTKIVSEQLCSFSFLEKEGVSFESEQKQGGVKGTKGAEFGGVEEGGRGRGRRRLKHNQ